MEEIQPVGVILVGCLRRIRDWRPNVGLISGVVPWPSTSTLAPSVTRPPVRLFVIGSGSMVSGFLRVLAWPGRCASTPSSARDPSSAKTTPPRGCRSVIILVSLCGYRGSRVPRLVLPDHDVGAVYLLRRSGARLPVVWWSPSPMLPADDSKILQRAVHPAL